jgi:hypothetical protein
VQYILDSVVDHLLADSSKRHATHDVLTDALTRRRNPWGDADALRARRARSFTYVEVAFFSRWWRAQRAPRRRAVLQLIQQARAPAHLHTQPRTRTPRCLRTL